MGGGGGGGGAPPLEFFKNGRVTYMQQKNHLGGKRVKVLCLCVLQVDEVHCWTERV